MIGRLRQLLGALLSLPIAFSACCHCQRSEQCEWGGHLYLRPGGQPHAESVDAAGYRGGPSNYNANDQLATATYDANGNTTVSIGLGYV